MNLVIRRLGLLLAALALVAVGCGDDEPTFAGIRRDPAPAVDVVSLPDASVDAEREFRAGEAGDLLAVYFGYTSCPDVCPTTLADFRQTLEQLGDDADRVEVAMVTIDPEVDTDELLTGYIQAFFPGASALRTEDADRLADAAEPFGAAYDILEAADGSREVVHSAHLYVVDHEGRLLLQWPFGQSADEMASDLRLLLSEA